MWLNKATQDFHYPEAHGLHQQHWLSHQKWLGDSHMPTFAWGPGCVVSLSTHAFSVPTLLAFGLVGLAGSLCVTGGITMVSVNLQHSITDHAPEQGVCAFCQVYFKLFGHRCWFERRPVKTRVTVLESFWKEQENVCFFFFFSPVNKYIIYLSSYKQQ